VREPASYAYVGPPEIREAAARQSAGRAIDSPAALRAWWNEAGRDDADQIATCVVTTDGVLRIAPRRSEHVACSAGGNVLAAGELGFEEDAGALRVVLVTNLSTGFCPRVESWESMAHALDAIGVARPATWTAAFEFRRCTECSERNVIKDDWWECAICGAAAGVELLVGSIRSRPAGGDQAEPIESTAPHDRTPDYSGILSVMTASFISARLRQTMTSVGRPTGVAATTHGSER